MSTPILSIIIPTLNEAPILHNLLAQLAEQEAIQSFEIIFVDGESSDQGLLALETDPLFTQLNIRCFSSKRGRARQMNFGAKQSQAEMLLFLHADTKFAQGNTLISAVQELSHSIQLAGTASIAGHFPLQFEHGGQNKRAYYYYQCKTHLNRLDCINGDQGFLLSKSFFTRLGGFDESHNYLEDFRLARKIFQQGSWQTLSAKILTSARRFEVEGLARRQVLNALICNMDHIGLTQFISQAASAYREQDRTKGLELKIYFDLIHKLCFASGLRQAVIYWWNTGKFVAQNIWQLFFAVDCLINQKKALPAGQGKKSYLLFYDKYLSPLCLSALGVTISTMVTLLWFYMSLLYLHIKPWAHYAFAKRP